MRLDRKKIICGCVVALAALANPLAVHPDGTAAARRKQLAEMSAEQVNELHRKEQRFHALPVEEQDRLRKLHAQIASDPRSAQLLETLRHYNEWLKTLDPVQQAELQGLSPGDRIARINELRQRDEQRHFPIANNARLSAPDMRAVLEWLDSFITTHQEEIIATLPKGRAQSQFRVADPQQRRIMLRLAYIRGIEGNEVPTPGSDDIAELRKRVSNEARKLLELPDAGQKILNWFAENGTGKRMPGDEELRVFYRDVLTEEQRQQVDNLPVDERKFKLRQMYFAHQRDTRLLGSDAKPRLDRFPRPPDGIRPARD